MNHNMGFGDYRTSESRTVAEIVPVLQVNADINRSKATDSDFMVGDYRERAKDSQGNSGRSD
jgi:hypothetical protein